jgi:protein-S-isoprenylcysteine O-methyltransferase Ste14
MSEYIKIILRITWVIVLGYWAISSFRVKKPQQKKNLFQNFILYWLPLFAAMLLLGPGEWFGRTFLREGLLPHTDAVGWTGLIFCFAGAGICCWARFLLGKNWSLSVQQKEDHELVKNGIYKWIRHPIYTGLLLLFIGNGIIVGDYRSILAVLIVLVSFLFKMRKEERLMMELFGQKYEEYRQTTKALIPFIY